VPVSSALNGLPIVKTFLKTIRIPIAIVILNGLIGLTIGELLSQTLGVIIFNAVRISVWCYAGWLVVAVGRQGIWKAPLAGLVLFFIDHPVMTGGAFAFAAESTALGGVLASFLMFLFVPMSVAALGGLVAKARATPSNI
jgi:hypothetical protein